MTEDNFMAAEILCRIYFNIAAEEIGPDEVRRRRDEKLEILDQDITLSELYKYHMLVTHKLKWWRDKRFMIKAAAIAFATWAICYCIWGCAGPPKYLRNPPKETVLFPENNKGPDRITKYLDDQGNPIWVWE